MDNPSMARLLAETADLLEIDGGDSFRIRSYRRAAEAAEQTTVDLASAASDTARLLEIPGIGKGMAANLQAIAATGTLPLRDELLAKYGSGLLELLKLPGMGPKTVALQSAGGGMARGRRGPRQPCVADDRGTTRRFRHRHR